MQVISAQFMSLQTLKNTPEYPKALFDFRRSLDPGKDGYFNRLAEQDAQRSPGKSFRLSTG